MKTWKDIAGPLVTDPLVVHDDKMAPMYLQELKKKENLKNAFRCPENLQIVTWSNYPQKTILEESLDFLGIINYVVLGRGLETFPLNAKIPLTLEFLKSPESTAPLVAWMDSRDAVLLGDPSRFITLLEESGCDALFSSTDFFFGGCEDIHAFERARPQADGTLTPYLNSGVMIGKKEFLIQVLEEAMTHIGEPFCPLDPKNDQPIFALMHKNHYPRLQVNADQRLALRPAFQDIYLFALETKRTAETFRETWWWQVLVTFKQMFIGRNGTHAAFFRYFLTPYERNKDGWFIHKRLERIRLLLQTRSDYTKAIREIRASWQTA